MGFVLDGDTIRVIGSETSLDGLGAVSGVTTTEFGVNLNNSISGGKTYYDIGTLELIVEGVLKMNSRHETIVISNGNTADKCKGITIASGGTFECSGYYNAYSVVDVETYNVGILDVSANTGAWNDIENNYTFYAAEGSIIKIEGSSIHCYNNVVFLGSGILKKILITGRSDNYPIIKLDSIDYIINEINIVGTHGIVFGQNNDLTIKGITVKSAAKTTQHDGTGWAYPYQVLTYPIIEDYVRAGGVQGDFKYWWCGPYKFKNAAYGSELNDIALSSHYLGTGFCVITKECEIVVNDKFNNPIMGVKTYIKDIDSGNRLDIVNDIGYTALTNSLPNLSEYQVYENITDVDGKVDVFEVVLGANTNAPNNDIYKNWDYRFNDDVVPINFIHYNYLLSQMNLSFKGVGILAISSIMFDDLLISETDRTIVDSYVTIDNAGEIYDKAKTYLIDNYNGESNTIVNKDGTQINCFDYEVVFDNTIDDPFIFNDNIISIKTSSYSGGVKTSNNLILKNGVVIQDGRYDCNIITNSGSTTFTNIVFGGKLIISEVGDYELINCYHELGVDDLIITLTSGIVNINVNGGNVPTYISSGATVNVIAGAVNVSVVVKDVLGQPIENARVLLLANDGGDLPYNKMVSIVNYGNVATVTHNNHGLNSGDKIQIRGGDLVENIGIYRITVIDDNSYSYNMSSIPNGSPIGTILITYVVLSDVTDSDGNVSVSRVFNNDQPISGRVRKSTEEPLYRTSDIVDNVSTNNGVSISVLMIRDE